MDVLFTFFSLEKGLQIRWLGETENNMPPGQLVAVTVFLEAGVNSIVLAFHLVCR